MKFPWHLIPDNPTMMNFKALFTNGIYNFQKWYVNTVVMTALTIAIKIFFVSFTAYGFARIKFRGKDVIFLILLSAMMIPSDIMIIPRYMIFKNLHILDSMWALILPSCVDVYFVFLLRQSFISIPDSISEAAKIDAAAICGFIGKSFSHWQNRPLLPWLCFPLPGPGMTIWGRICTYQPWISRCCPLE